MSGCWATETGMPMEALEIIRRMAVRYGDDQIASVLNRCGYSTGKGKRWNQTRVATARRNHSIAGQSFGPGRDEIPGYFFRSRACARARVCCCNIMMFTKRTLPAIRNSPILVVTRLIRDDQRNQIFVDQVVIYRILSRPALGWSIRFA